MKELKNIKPIKADYSRELTSKIADTSKEQILTKSRDVLSTISESASMSTGIIGQDEKISRSVFTSEDTTPNFTINEIPLVDQSIEKIFSDFLVHSTIYIEGVEILKGDDFEVTISQKTCNHDEFEIICFAESLETPNSLPLTKTREYLGKSLLIKFQQFGKQTYTFSGIITSIVNDKYNNYEGNIIINGNSPTILLENGLDCQSYENKNLKSIIEKSTEEYQGLNIEINPRTEDIFLYTVQYKESDFQFLRRMSERYGEWFYYNGEKIVFGKREGKEVELYEDKDVDRFEFRMKTLPQKFQYMAYNAKTGGMEEVNSEEISHINIYNPYVVKALKASETLYSKSPNMLYNQSLLESGRTELKSAVERQKKSRANVFEVYIKTRKPGIQLGDIIKLKGYMPGNKLLNTSDVPLESYRVTEIKHHHSGTEYYNEIVGVPKDQEIPNYINEEAIPRCEEQSAIVTDNNDPGGMGRIRVEFPWQKPIGEQSPWIRLTTPYAGKGKGMHVIPEIGEEVLVGFESGNAEKPVILGAMFNGKSSSGHGGSGNFMKGLATASGSSLMFNDNTGSMNLADKGGASMNFDGAGNSVLQTEETILFSCGESSLEMKKDGTILINGKNIGVFGKDIGVLGETSIAIGIGGESVTSGIGIEAQTLDVGTKTLTLSGESEANLGSSGKINIGGGSETNISSGKVKIN